MGSKRLCAWAICGFAAAAVFAQGPAETGAACGEVVSVATHGGSTTRYSLARPVAAAAALPVTLVLLAGGPGHVDLDGKGCARALKGNSLVRSVALFNAVGFHTALVDAPSDHHGEDGLGGFRVAPQHAEDLGKVIADLRERTRGAVWLVGTSRGSISAVNAASRLRGSAAPDGIVLTSALTVGQPGAKKAWVAHSVFDLPLEAITLPVLIVGHTADACARSPAGLMANITARTNGAREQVVAVSGGPGTARATSPEACEGRSPHGFWEQEAEVAAGIARFVRGGRY
jgi:hypothetical protein